MDNILIIYTGGTIGMVKDAITGSLKPFDFGEIYARIPELHAFDCHIDFITLEPLIDSSDVTIDNWVEMALLIKKNYARYKAFIILHGTDTMAYTASALSFILEGLNKPVILTGSQLPIGAVRTDARLNLITTIEMAYQCIKKNLGLSEVCICFDDVLMRGNRCENIHLQSFMPSNQKTILRWPKPVQKLFFISKIFYHNPKSNSVYRSSYAMTSHC